MPFLGQGQRALQNRVNTGRQQGIWDSADQKKKRPDRIGAQVYLNVNIAQK